MSDRYTKTLLTIIAAALVYLCVVMTPLPGVQAQTAKRPGDPTGPGEMVIVGWRAPKGETLPVTVFGSVVVENNVPLKIDNTVPFRITGDVKTERSAGAADRVVLVGWEENGNRKQPAPLVHPFGQAMPGLPVQQK